VTNVAIGLQLTSGACRSTGISIPSSPEPLLIENMKLKLTTKSQIVIRPLGLHYCFTYKFITITTFSFFASFFLFQFTFLCE